MPPNRPTQTPPSTGSILLGKYHIGRLLGRGSFAKVYQAHALTDDNTTVAVKIIDKNKTIDVDMEPRVLREIAAMRRLHHHPNILKIYEVMATKSKIYLVVEYASGGELFTKISQRGRLKEQEARRYFKQLVSALNFCHQNGVAHRDVKPQNLLLDNNGNVKISDFGLSALPEQLRNGMLHTACGTPAYTAPEVLSRRSYDGAKADSWSVGVILYLMLSGHLPFDDINLGAMYKKIHLRQYQIPGWVSKSARYLIYRLLDPDPNTRMHMEDLMQSSWFKTERSLELKYRNEFTGDSSCKVVDMNAFDIISMSSGLDLSGLFETEGGRKEKRFTTRGRVEEVEERVSEMGRDLGYGVERKKGCGIRLWKAKVVLAVEVVEIVAAELVRVDIKVVEGRVEFEVIEWEDFQTKLQGIGDRSLINPCA